MKKKCSLSLDTRVKDRRNIIANLSHQLDCKRNIPYNEEDDAKKCEIFAIPTINTDFITGKLMKGIGDHLYPLAKDAMVKKLIGSDSGWNRIPVSGYNSKYKESTDNEIQDKISAWKIYVKERNGLMYHEINDNHIQKLNELQNELVETNRRIFKELCEIDI